MLQKPTFGLQELLWAQNDIQPTAVKMLMQLSYR